MKYLTYQTQIECTTAGRVVIKALLRQMHFSLMWDGNGGSQPISCHNCTCSILYTLVKTNDYYTFIHGVGNELKNVKGQGYR